MSKIDLLQGDCLELMKDIPDASIDMILCDLPYGTTRNKWDTIIPLEPLWEQYERVIKQNGAIVLFSQQPFTSTLVSSNPALFRYEWIWEKANSTGFLNANKMPLKLHENIAVFYNTTRGALGTNYGKVPARHVSNSDGSRYPVDIIKFNKDHGMHPTQKPVALTEYLVRTYTNAGDTVLDNCMGSGTTGVACKNLGRDFIGIELDETYFNIAKERIENYEVAE